MFESSTTLSTGASRMNSESKFETSTCPLTLGLNGGGIFIDNSLSNSGQIRAQWRGVQHSVLFPINLREERHSLDLIRAIGPEPSGGVTLEQCGDEASRIMRHILWESNDIMKNPLVHLVHVLIVERWKASLNTWVRSKFREA